jgi:molybdate transport system ATP-binding protein
VAIFDLDLAVALRAFRLELALSAGRETVALVGPSGAGKTTVLRAIAGLLRPDEGRIAHDGEAWLDTAAGIDLPPQRRSVGLVFQDYALFPHMTVRENVAFGGTGRADELLERFRVADLATARPATLSGGERQRVALARALARDPAVLLLDEPLAALDTHTRAHVRAELQKLLAELSLPALLITHDFRDAAALADRVGVLAEGRLRQLDTSAELAARPADALVAAIAGENLLPGTARPLPDGGAEVALDGGGIVRSVERAAGRVGVAVHPWDVAVASAPPEGRLNALPGLVGESTPDGGRVRVRVGELLCECAPGREPPRGQRAYATFAPAAARLVAREG